MKWSEEETVTFVELYRESECLWNVVSPLYKDKNVRQKALESIVNDMKKDGFGVQEAKQKIKNIRSTYNQELLKVKKSTKSGAGSVDVYTPTLKWFTILEPLMKIVKGSSKTANNLETENVDDETEMHQDKDDTFDFEHSETTNNEAEAGVSGIPAPKTTIETKQNLKPKQKAPKRKLQELSQAVKELKSVSEILVQPKKTEREQDEIEVFGKYVSKSLAKLSTHDSICAQQEIQGILTKYRLNSMRPPSSATSINFIDSVGSHSCSNTEYEEEEMEDMGGTLEEVSAVLGRGAELPCNIEPSGKEDRVYMVLWFREGAGKPLYRYDVRGRSFNNAVMWSDTNAFGPRAFFVTGKQPAAALQLDAVQLEDAGIYRCRVDFRNSPTKNFQVKLTVIVPPHSLLLYDNSGRAIAEGIVGPLKEGDDLVLKCEVRGGNPAPTLSWFVNDKIVVDGKVEREGENVIVNRLEVIRLRRDQLNTTFKCQASNTKLVQPKEKTIRLEMFLKPLSASIIHKPVELVAYENYNMTCEVIGSRPTSDVTWFREGRKFKRGKVDQDANETVLHSSVLFTTAPEDDGHILKCQASNPKIDASTIEDSVTLNVVYPPIVTLQLGTSLKPNEIKEGDDVYFECNIKANPREHKISWHHNGQVLTQNMSNGVIFSTHSLVLQGVTRHNAGSYTCSAVNAKGETTSEPVTLRVQFAPVCRLDEPTIVGASIDEVLRVRCEVQADPSDVSFVWQFNNSGESFEVPPEKYATSNGSTSEFRYTPSSERDYGTLTCWGKNKIGRQVEPCVYQLVPASKPSSLKNCTLRSTVNTTGDWLEVECVSGFDGGMPQTFHLEVVDPATSQVRLNLTTSVVPAFRVELASLQQGQAATLQLVLYAANQKGHSDSVVLEDIAIRDAEKRTEWVGGGTTINMNGVSILVTSVATGVLVAILILAMILIRRRRSTAQHLQTSVKQLELTHGDQHRYVVAYQLKPETKQPDILSRISDEPLERDVPSLSYNGPVVMATFSPCTSPTCSLRSAGSPSVPMRPTTIGFTHTSPPPPPLPPLGVNMNMNGTLRAKEHILSNTIPGPESCV